MFHKNLGFEVFYAKEVAEANMMKLSRFSVFFLTLPKHLVNVPFYVSEKFWYRKILCIRRGYHNFLSKVFSLTEPKHFVEEPFWVPKIFGYRKTFMHQKGIWRFSVENFCLTVPKNFVVEPLCVYKNFWYRNILCIRRVYHDFLSRFIVSQYRKISWRNLFVFHKNSGIEIFYA